MYEILRCYSRMNPPIERGYIAVDLHTTTHAIVNGSGEEFVFKALLFSSEVVDIQFQLLEEHFRNRRSKRWANGDTNVTREDVIEELKFPEIQA